jgi:hypothetical protein
MHDVKSIKLELELLYSFLEDIEKHFTAFMAD